MKFTRFFLTPDSWGRKRKKTGPTLGRGGLRGTYDVTDDRDEPLLPEFDKIGDLDADIRSSIGATGARRPASE